MSEAETKVPRLTVADVRDLCLTHGKDWAVLLSSGGADDGVQYVTWGRAALDKVFASDLSEEISAWINRGGSTCLDPATGPATIHESFKLDAAKNKARVEELEKQNQVLRGGLDRVRRILADMIGKHEGEMGILQDHVARMGAFGQRLRDLLYCVIEAGVTSENPQ